MDRAHRGKPVGSDVLQPGRRHRRFVQLPDETERMVALQLATTRRENGHSGGARMVMDDGNERALPRPRSAFDDQQRAVSRARGAQRAGERLDRSVTVLQLPSGYPHST